jgi:hypothetical protein
MGFVRHESVQKLQKGRKKAKTAIPVLFSRDFLTKSSNQERAFNIFQRPPSVGVALIQPFLLPHLILPVCGIWDLFFQIQ